jgi:hypothetical protein
LDFWGPNEPDTEKKYDEQDISNGDGPLSSAFCRKVSPMEQAVVNSHANGELNENKNGRTKPHIEKLLLEMCSRFLPLLVPRRAVLLNSLNYMTTLWLMHDNIAFFLSEKALCRFNEESGIFSQYGSVLGLKRKA